MAEHRSKTREQTGHMRCLNFRNKTQFAKQDGITSNRSRRGDFNAATLVPGGVSRVHDGKRSREFERFYRPRQKRARVATTRRDPLARIRADLPSRARRERGSGRISPATEPLPGVTRASKDLSSSAH